MEIEQLYNQWCKETKRNGAILIGGSIREFFIWLEEKGYIITKNIENNHKFIKHTPHGKLMQVEQPEPCCIRCKYFKENDSSCIQLTDAECLKGDLYYFAKDENT